MHFGHLYLRLRECPGNRLFFGDFPNGTCLGDICVGGHQDICMFMFIVSTIIIMFSESQSSQGLTSSPYGAPILDPRHVHSITASASDKPTLPTEPCCQSGVDHGRRQSDAITGRETAVNVPTRLHQDPLIPDLRLKDRPVNWRPDSTYFSGSASLLSNFQKGDQDVLPSHFKEPSNHLNSNVNPDLNPDLFSTPPSPLDLSALHDTWEHVRVYCDSMVQVIIHQLIHSCLTPTEEHRSHLDLMLRLGRSVPQRC